MKTISNPKCEFDGVGLYILYALGMKRQPRQEASDERLSTGY